MAPAPTTMRLPARLAPSWIKRQGGRSARKARANEESALRPRARSETQVYPTGHRLIGPRLSAREAAGCAGARPSAAQAAHGAPDRAPQDKQGPGDSLILGRQVLARLEAIHQPAVATDGERDAFVPRRMIPTKEQPQDQEDQRHRSLPFGICEQGKVRLPIRIDPVQRSLGRPSGFCNARSTLTIATRAARH